MKTKEIRDLTDEELVQRLDDSKKELLNLRVQQATGQLENMSRLREVRRDIARLHTLSNERSPEAR